MVTDTLGFIPIPGTPALVIPFKKVDDIITLGVSTSLGVTLGGGRAGWGKLATGIGAGFYERDTDKSQLGKYFRINEDLTVSTIGNMPSAYDSSHASTYTTQYSLIEQICEDASYSYFLMGDEQPSLMRYKKSNDTIERVQQNHNIRISFSIGTYDNAKCFPAQKAFLIKSQGNSYAQYLGVCRLTDGGILTVGAPLEHGTTGTTTDGKAYTSAHYGGAAILSEEGIFAIPYVRKECEVASADGSVNEIGLAFYKIVGNGLVFLFETQDFIDIRRSGKLRVPYDFMGVACLYIDSSRVFMQVQNQSTLSIGQAGIYIVDISSGSPVCTLVSRENAPDTSTSVATTGYYKGIDCVGMYYAAAFPGYICRRKDFLAGQWSMSELVRKVTPVPFGVRPNCVVTGIPEVDEPVEVVVCRS